MIKHIKTVAVYVADQQRSEDFYTHKIGFEISRNEPMGPGGNWIEIATPGAQTCLVLYPRSMPDWEHLKPSEVFACDDAAATCKDSAARSVQITQQPKRMAWGTSAKFADPDGNEFVLMSQ